MQDDATLLNKYVVLEIIGFYRNILVIPNVITFYCNFYINKQIVLKCVSFNVQYNN